MHRESSSSNHAPMRGGGNCSQEHRLWPFSPRTVNGATAANSAYIKDLAPLPPPFWGEISTSPGLAVPRRSPEL